MPLIRCLDCEREISDRAVACPNCGGPISSSLAAIPVDVDRQLLSKRPKVRGAAASFAAAQPSKLKEAAVMALATLAFAAALGVSTNTISFGDPAEALGYAAGSAVVLLAIPCIVLFFAQAKTAWKTLIVMGILLALGQWSSYTAVQDSAEQGAALELAETSRDVFNEQRRLLEKYNGEPPSDNSEESLLAPTATAPLTSATLGSQQNVRESENALVLRKMTAFIVDQSAKSSALQEKIGKAVLDLRLEETLEPTALTSAAGIVRSRAKLVQYAGLIDEAEQLSANFAEELERGLRELAKGAQLERSIMSGFHEGRRKRAEIDRLMVVNQRALIESSTHIVDFMEARLGKTIVEGGQIYFETTSEASTYNGMIAKVRELVEEETSLTRQLDTLFKENVKEAERLAARVKRH